MSDTNTPDEAQDDEFDDIRVFNIKDGYFNVSVETVSELQDALGAILGESGEHEDAPDDYTITITFKRMTQKAYDALEPPSEWQ